MDGDGKMEVLVATPGDSLYRPGHLYCLNYDGTLKWKKDPPLIQYRLGSAPVLGDLDGDGLYEVVVQSLDYATLYAFDGDGSPMWEHYQGDWRASGSLTPLLLDVDGDSLEDVVFYAAKQLAEENSISAIKGLDGQVVFWERKPVYGTFSWVSFDVDGGGQLDVVRSGSDSARAIDGADGNPLWSFRKDKYPLGLHPPPAVVDVDGDGYAEIALLFFSGGGGSTYERVVLDNPNVSVGEGTGERKETYLTAAPSVFQNRTLISFGTKGDEAVNVELYDPSGRKVKTLFRGLPEGPVKLQWDGRGESGFDLPAGVYIVRLSTPGTVLTRTVVKTR